MNVERLRELLAQLPGRARVETYNVDMTGFVIEDEETQGRWLIWLPWHHESNQNGWIKVLRGPKR